MVALETLEVNIDLKTLNAARQSIDRITNSLKRQQKEQASSNKAWKNIAGTINNTVLASFTAISAAVIRLSPQGKVFTSQMNVQIKRLANQVGKDVKPALSLISSATKGGVDAALKTPKPLRQGIEATGTAAALGQAAKIAGTSAKFGLQGTAAGGALASAGTAISGFVTPALVALVAAAVVNYGYTKLTGKSFVDSANPILTPGDSKSPGMTQIINNNYNVTTPTNYSGTSQGFASNLRDWLSTFTSSRSQFQVGRS